MDPQAGPQFVPGVSRNLDFDGPVVPVHYDQRRMKNFPNQPELGNPPGTVFIFYTKGVHSLASRGWFPKGCLSIKVGDIRRCAHNIR